MDLTNVAEGKDEEFRGENRADMDISYQLHFRRSVQTGPRDALRCECEALTLSLIEHRTSASFSARRVWTEDCVKWAYSLP